jgi:hypothetical protein
MFAESLKAITANVRASRENAQNIAYENFLTDNHKFLHRIECHMQLAAEQGDDDVNIEVGTASSSGLGELKRYPCPDTFIQRFFLDKGFKVSITNTKINISWANDE